ncbi:hypothetical protein HWV62_14110 [Athelia sp. TMB]|nr:hypothetical protein HWV62_14110 [Athelia sp. TMB]
MLPYVTGLGPAVLRRALVEHTPFAVVQNIRKMVDVMDDTSHEIVHSKQKTNTDVPGQVGDGKDIMSILLKANVEAAEEDRLTDTEVIGQVT